MATTLWLLLAVIAAAGAVPAAAQLRPVPTRAAPVEDEEEQPRPPGVQPQRPTAESDPAGRIARAPAGVVGQRQTRDGAAQEAGIAPMGRIANRLQTRVQNRIRSRIDRGYAPQIDPTDAFTTAEDQARAPVRPR